VAESPQSYSSDEVEVLPSYSADEVEIAQPKQYLPEVNRAIAAVPKPASVLDVAAAYPGTLPTHVPKNWTGKPIQTPRPGLPEVAGMATELAAPGTVMPGRLDISPAETVKTGVREMQTPGKRATGALRTTAGALEAAGPLAGPLAVENPLTFVRAAGEGYVAGKGAKYGTRALGGSAEQQGLAEDIGQAAPILAHAALQPELGVETTPEGTRVAGTVAGGRAGAGVAVTPEGVTVRGKVGPLEGSKTFRRTPQAAPARTIEAPTIEAEPPFTRSEIARAQQATNYAGPQQAEAYARQQRAAQRAAAVSGEAAAAPAEGTEPAKPATPAPPPEIKKPVAAPPKVRPPSNPPQAGPAAAEGAITIKTETGKILDVDPSMGWVKTGLKNGAITLAPREMKASEVEIASPSGHRALEGEVLPKDAKLPVARLDAIKEEIRNQYPGNSEEKIEKAAREQLEFEETQRRGSAIAKSSFKEGDPVTLTDGRRAKVEFVSPPDKTPVVRVRTDDGEKVSLTKQKDIDQLTEGTKYKHGSTQANIPEGSEAHSALEAARARISESDLAGQGRDVGGNHVTVRYGIQSDDVEGIKKYLSSLAPFEASLGKTGKFPPSENSDNAAVIMAPIEAPELHRINAEIEQHGDFAKFSFPEYKPHATVAYVDPAKAGRYVGMSVTEGKKFPVNEIAITDKDGAQTVVKLEGKADDRQAAQAGSAVAQDAAKAPAAGAKDQAAGVPATQGDGKAGAGAEVKPAPVYEQNYRGPLDIKAIEKLKNNPSLSKSIRDAARAVHEAVVDSAMRLKDAMNLLGGDELAKALGGKFVKVPDDGSFYIPNIPKAIDHALKAAGKFDSSKAGEALPKAGPKTFRVTSPKEFDNAKYMAGLEKEIAELTKELGSATSPHREFIQEQLKAARENLAEAKQSEPVGAGSRVVPGARSATTGNETGATSIQDLTDSIQRQAGEKSSVKTRINLGADIAAAREGATDTVSRAFARLKGATAALWDAYSRPPHWTDYEDATGKWSGADQVNALDLERFTKAIKEAVPSKVKREAISNWIEAAGDDAVLRERAEKSKSPWKAGYEAALTLTDAEKTIARNVMNRNDATLEEAQKAGLLQQGVENYVRHIYADNPKMISKVMAEMNFTSLQTKPSFTKQRTLPTYFDAEQLGFKPKDKDIGFLTASHERAFREALAARDYIKSLMEGEAKDGRPLVVTSWSSAKELPETEGKKSAAYLIKPNIKPEEEYADYRRIDHPAMRGWRWAGQTTEGEPIFVQGDALVHPDIYRKLSNNLGRSAIRAFQVEVGGHSFRLGSALLNVSSEVKHGILSFSGFHQTTLGIHALEHRTLPAGMPELDMSKPDQRFLVDHGLNVAQYDAAEAFSEGVASGGLITKIPIIGPAYHAYVDYLFKDYLPRVKMAMGLHALARNRALYSDKLSDHQIGALTAREANAAFGGLNYKMLGRNKTLQDVMRLVLMAPDFTEARARFAGQAARPYGREQLVALLGGALVLYTLGRILNQALDDNPHWDKPFTLVHKGKEYNLRTVQGDIMSALEKPGQYVRNRLSPLLNTGIQAMEGRDRFGHKQTLWRLGKEMARNNVPIPAQPWTKESDDPWAKKALSSILKMVGVNEATSLSNAMKRAAELRQDNSGDHERTLAQRQHWRDIRRAIQDYHKSNGQDYSTAVKLAESGTLSEYELREMEAGMQMSPLGFAVRGLPAEDVLQVYQVATDQEKRELLEYHASAFDKLIEQHMEAAARAESEDQPKVAETERKEAQQLIDELQRLSEESAPLGEAPPVTTTQPASQ
jgi:2'-5' RNA ligase